MVQKAFAFMLSLDTSATGIVWKLSLSVILEKATLNRQPSTIGKIKIQNRLALFRISRKREYLKTDRMIYLLIPQRFTGNL